MKNVGEKLRLAREFLGLTQEQVADTLNMTRNVIGNVENSKRELKSDELLKFSKLYGISMEEILLDEPKLEIGNQVFARGFEKLSEKDKREIINLIKFKNNNKE